MFGKKEKAIVTVRWQAHRMVLLATVAARAAVHVALNPDAYYVHACLSSASPRARFGGGFFEKCDTSLDPVALGKHVHSPHCSYKCAK